MNLPGFVHVIFIIVSLFFIMLGVFSLVFKLDKDQRGPVFWWVITICGFLILAFLAFVDLAGLKMVITSLLLGPGG